MKQKPRRRAARGHFSTLKKKEEETLLNTPSSIMFLPSLRGNTISVAGIRMYSKIIIATVDILLVGVKRDIKAINHCLSVLISVREIREIGSYKSWLGDSTLRLHSSWRYRFIVLKTHSGE